MRKLENKTGGSIMKRPEMNVMKLMKDQPKLFIISPVQVLIVSLIFIGIVFALHLYSRFVGTGSYMQLGIAIIALIVSSVFSYMTIGSNN